MAKYTLSNSETTFSINGDMYAKGSVPQIRYNDADGTVSIMPSFCGRQYFARYDDYATTDGPFASLAELKTYIQENFFFNVAGGGGSEFVTIPFNKKIRFDKNYESSTTLYVPTILGVDQNNPKNGNFHLVKLTGGDISFTDDFIKDPYSDDYDPAKMNVIKMRREFGKVRYYIYNYEADAPFILDIHRLWIEPLDLIEFDQSVTWNSSQWDDYVHPFPLYVPGGWNGYKYIMAITPYPATQSELEDPMLFVSNNPRLNGFETLPGTPVPLYTPDVNTNHFSDPSICLDDDGQTLHYIFRGVYNAGGDAYIAYTKTTDGINFDPFVKIIDTANGSIDIVSPTLLKWNNQYFIFATENVNQDKLAVYKAIDPSNPGSWSKINDIDLGILGELWHCDVRFINNEFYVLGSTNWINGAYLRLGKFTTPTDATLSDARQTPIAWIGGGKGYGLASYYKSSFIIKEDNTIEFFNGLKTGNLDGANTKWRIAEEKVNAFVPTFQPILDSLEIVADYADNTDPAFTSGISEEMQNEFYCIEAELTGYPFELIAFKNTTYTRAVIKVTAEDAPLEMGYFNQGGYYLSAVNVGLKIGDKLAIYREGLSQLNFYVNNVLVYKAYPPELFINRRGIGFGVNPGTMDNIKIYQEDTYIPDESRYNDKFADRLLDAISNPNDYFLSDTFNRAAIGTTDEIGNVYENYGFDIASNELAPTAMNCRIAAEVNAPFEALIKMNAAALSQGSFILKYTDQDNYTYINISMGMVEKVAGVDNVLSSQGIMSKPLTHANISVKWNGNVLYFLQNDAEIGRVDWNDITHFGYANLFTNERIDQINIKKL